MHPPAGKGDGSVQWTKEEGGWEGGTDSEGEELDVRTAVHEALLEGGNAVAGAVEEMRGISTALGFRKGAKGGRLLRKGSTEAEQHEQGFGSLSLSFPPNPIVRTNTLPAEYHPSHRTAFFTLLDPPPSRPTDLAAPFPLPILCSESETHPASPSSLTFSQTVSKIPQFSLVCFSSVAFAVVRWGVVVSN